MPESQLFFRTCAKRFDLVIIYDEVAIRPQQIVCHQISIV